VVVSSKRVPLLVLVSRDAVWSHLQAADNGKEFSGMVRNSCKINRGGIRAVSDRLRKEPSNASTQRSFKRQASWLLFRWKLLEKVYRKQI